MNTVITQVDETAASTKKKRNLDKYRNSIKAQEQIPPAAPPNTSGATPAPETPAQNSTWKAFFAKLCCLGPLGARKNVQQQATPANAKIIKSSESVSRRTLLPKLAPEDVGKKCLVLDLDETLVHSSFKVRRRNGLLTLKARRKR